MKYSIVMPVYNAGKYIENAINSILNQDYTDIELIIVNDGSTDNTLEVCNEINDNRVKVITIENSGPAHARNVGIQNTTGNFLAFIDADDTYDRNFISDINILKKDSEYILTRIMMSDNQKFSGEIIYKQIEEIKQGYIFKLLEGIINSPVGKVYDLNLIKEYNILFDEMLDVGEDFNFNLRYLMLCNKICIINRSYYNYNINDGSISFRYKSNYLQKRIVNIELVDKIITECNLECDLVNLLKIKLIYALPMNYFANKTKEHKEILYNELDDEFFKTINKTSSFLFNILLMIYNWDIKWLIILMAKILFVMKNNKYLKGKTPSV